MSSVYADYGGVIPHGAVSYLSLTFIDAGFGQYKVAGLDQGIQEKFSLTKLHGWLFWVAWALFGLLQPVSARYLKKYWRVNMWVHRIVGTLILLLTISMGLVGISKMNWELSGDEPHYMIGLIIFFVTIFVAVGGVFARSMTRRLEWKTKVIHRIQGLHKFAGRAFIILG
jgi:amino acid permease